MNELHTQERYRRRRHIAQGVLEVGGILFASLTLLTFAILVESRGAAIALALFSGFAAVFALGAWFDLSDRIKDYRRSRRERWIPKMQEEAAANSNSAAGKS